MSGARWRASSGRCASVRCDRIFVVDVEGFRFRLWSFAVMVGDTQEHCFIHVFSTCCVIHASLRISYHLWKLVLGL